MRGPSRLTDDQITSMLLERAASPTPADLSASVLASVREARHRQHRLVSRRTVRPGMLLVAAALVTIGSIVAVGFVGSRLTTPPSRTAPAAVEASPTPVAVQQIWIGDPSPAFTVTRDPFDTADLYWRAATFDRIDLNAYGHSRTTTISRLPGAPLFDRLADDVNPAGRLSVTFTITPDGFRDSRILSPAMPVEVAERTELLVVGQGGYFSSLERAGGTGPYTVTAAILEPGQLDVAALRATGRDYPQEIIDLYTQVAPGSLGPNARSLQAKVLAGASSAAPIDVANEVVDLLRSSEYTYKVDVRDLDCVALSTVECFATIKVGFCQHYAITMAVILRDLGIPTRIVQGFRPGTRERSASVEVVANSRAHTWVEVYFNGFGWIEFDPTPEFAPGPALQPSDPGGR